MSRVYLHSQNSYKKFLTLLLSLLLVFFMYGFYKNGLKLYLNGQVSFFKMFKPLFLLLTSVSVNFIFNRKSFWDTPLVLNFLSALIVPYNVNVFVFITILLALNFLQKYKKFNFISLLVLLIILSLFIFKDYSFYNPFEASFNHKYSVFDFLMGKGYGAIGNTFLLFSFISFLVLLLNINYKKSIPIISFSIYYFLIIITAFLTKNFSYELLLNNNLIFAFIFISPISEYSPYTRGGQYIYSLLLGLLTFAFSFIDVNLGVYLSLLLVGVLSPYLDKMIKKIVVI